MTQRIIHLYEYPYFISTVTAERRWLFCDSGMAQELHRAIITCCAIKGFDLISHGICPDHVYLMVWKTDPTRVGEPALYYNGHLRWLFPKAQRTFSNVRADRTISDLMQSIKGTFSRSIHQGQIWQPRYNFRIIGSDERFFNTLQYIQFNYLKHDLPAKYGRPPYVFINDKITP